MAWVGGRVGCTVLKSMNHNSLGCEQPYITHRPRCKHGSHPMYMYIPVYDCIVILTGLCDREGEGDGERQTGRGERQRGECVTCLDGQSCLSQNSSHHP